MTQSHPLVSLGDAPLQAVEEVYVAAQQHTMMTPHGLKSTPSLWNQCREGAAGLPCIQDSMVYGQEFG